MEICLVMKNNFKRSLRHKIRWAVIFVMPLVFSLATIVLNQIQDHTYRIGVIDSTATVSTTTDSTTNSVETYCLMLDGRSCIDAKAADPDTCHTDLILGTYNYIMDCSKGFSEEAILSTGSEKEKHELYLMLSNDKESKLNIETQNSSHPSVMEQTVGYLMSLFLIMSVLQGGMYLRDKSQGLMERFCYAPNKKWDYIAGNLCFIFLITLIQAAVSFLLLCVINKTWLSFAASFEIIGLIATVASVFAVILCTICKNDTQAGISASAIATVVTAISGMFVSIESMPQVLQFISKFSPIRWCIDLVKF